MEKLNDEIYEAFAFGPIMMSVSQQIVIQGLECFATETPKALKSYIS